MFVCLFVRHSLVKGSHGVNGCCFLGEIERVFALLCFEDTLLD